MAGHRLSPKTEVNECEGFDCDSLKEAQGHSSEGNTWFNLYLYHHSCFTSLPALLHSPDAMFILAFVFAGALMLGVLQPRFTMSLIRQTIPQAELLLAEAPHRCRRLASAYLLSGTPWTLQGDRWLSRHLRPTLPSPTHSNILDLNLLVLPGSRFNLSVTPSRPPQWVSSTAWTVDTLYYPSIALGILPLALRLMAFFAFVILLRWVCCRLAERFHLPQQSSPTQQFVQDLEKKVKSSPLALPMSSFGLTHIHIGTWPGVDTKPRPLQCIVCSP